MPTSYGYIGQRADAATSGLDYYGARYYDPTVGQFTSADTLVAGGLNRYGYVGGNPETLTDPSGHIKVEKDDFLVGAGLALGAGLILTAPVAQAPSVTGGLSGGVWIATDDSHGQATGYEFLNEMDIPYGWDGTPTWNQRTAPRSGPRSNPNLTPVHETQHTGGGASGGPQTQTGGAGAGAPPGGGKPPVASPVPGDDDGCGCGDTVPVYRVQGGGSMERIIVDASGNIRIEGEGMLHLSFANSAHAEYFLGLRGAGAYIVTFQIQATFLDFLRSVAVPQRLASRYPDSPQIDDPRQWTDVYGLRSNLFNELQEFTVSGSGRIIRPGDNC